MDPHIDLLKITWIPLIDYMDPLIDYHETPVGLHGSPYRFHGSPYKFPLGVIE